MCNNPTASMVFVIRRRTRYLFRQSRGDIKAVDPLNQGVNAQHPSGLESIPSRQRSVFGEDGGLNFSGYRFNAPSHRSDLRLSARSDVHLDRAAKHTLSVRERFADNTDDRPAQLPGQRPAQPSRHSKGFAAQYTPVLRTKSDHVLKCELHAIGQALSGVRGPLLFQTNLDPLQNPTHVRSLRPCPH